MTPQESLVSARFGRAAHTYEEKARVQRAAMDELTNFLLTRRSSFSEILEIGCGTGRWSREIALRAEVSHLTLNDLSALMLETARSKLPKALASKTDFWLGNAERDSWPHESGQANQPDLVLAGSVLQWFSRPKNFFDRLARALRPGGLAALVTFGPANCREIRLLTGAGLAYPDFSTLCDYATPFRILHAHESILRQVFETPRAVLQHLRDTGVTATNGNFRWTTSTLRHFEEAYAERFAHSDNPTHGVTLTYHPIVFVLEKTCPCNL